MMQTTATATGAAISDHRPRTPVAGAVAFAAAIAVVAVAIFNRV
ncbi:MAG TPA: hypothetical protein VF183_07635 [Acidimicrobiales bacterium]